jgi:hypothetical protein
MWTTSCGCSSTLTLQVFWTDGCILILGESDLGLFRYPFHDPAELAEALDRFKAVRLQAQFGFQVLHAIQQRRCRAILTWKKVAARLDDFGSRLEDSNFSIV